MADHKLFQDEKTGKLVEFISKHDKEYAMVRDAAGTITYLSLEQLVPYDKDKGRMAKIKAPVHGWSRRCVGIRKFCWDPPPNDCDWR